VAARKMHRVCGAGSMKWMVMASSISTENFWVTSDLRVQVMVSAPKNSISKTKAVYVFAAGSTLDRLKYDSLPSQTTVMRPLSIESELRLVFQSVGPGPFTSPVSEVASPWFSADLGAISAVGRASAKGEWGVPW
jgi:hypothetical protein